MAHGGKRVSFQFHHHLFRGGGTAVLVPVRKSFRPKDGEAAVRAKESCGSELE
jgi:hypothetical protein